MRSYLPARAELGDYRRAAEWTEAANRWCDRVEVTGFPGACRIHRAEVMRLRGEPETQVQLTVQRRGDRVLVVVRRRSMQKAGEHYAPKKE